MKLTRLAMMAKKELDKRGGAKAIADQAKAEYQRRGGTEGLKTSAKQVADAAKTAKTPGEKAKAAADVLRKEAQRTGTAKR